MVEALSIAEGQVIARRLTNGATLRAHLLLEPKVIPGEVAYHEALHAEATGSDGIYEATNRPSGNALGTTRPRIMTAIAAAAPAAFNFRGTAWDEIIVKYGLGANWELAKAAARQALTGRLDYVHEIAVAIEEKGTISQQDVHKAHEKVDRRRQGIRPVWLEVVNKEGKKRVIVTETSPKNTVEVPRELTDLPLAV